MRHRSEHQGGPQRTAARGNLMKDERPSPLRELLEPPPHIPKRCGARARTTGAPCRKWACKGRSRCRLHGGARGSGRPATTGKYTAEALRARRLLHVIRRLLARFYRRPEPIEAPPGSCDVDAVIAQALMAYELTAMSASRSSRDYRADAAGEPASPELLEREMAGAGAARATQALLRQADPDQFGAPSDTSAIRKLASAPAVPPRRHSPRASRS